MPAENNAWLKNINTNKNCHVVFIDMVVNELMNWYMKTTICSRFLLSGILWWLFFLTGSKGSVQLGAGFHGDHGRFLTDYVCKCLCVWFSLTFSSQPRLVKWILSLFCWRSRTLSMPLGVLGIWGSQPYFYRPIFTWWVMWSILSGW